MPIGPPEDGSEQEPPAMVKPSAQSEGGVAQPSNSGSQPSDSGAAPTTAARSVPPEVSERFIAFDSDRAEFNRDLYLMRADGSEVRRLTQSASSEREPAISPDGKKLAYVSNATAPSQVYVYDFATRSSHVVTARADGADQPAWFPDSKRLAFHSGASVFVIDQDGKNEALIGTGLNHFNAFKNPAVSADGLELFIDRNNEINALHLETQASRRVIQNSTTTIEAPAISPDGLRIAYAVNCFKGGTQIEVADLGSTPTPPCDGVRISPEDQERSARSPAWGPRGYIAYERVDGSGLSSIMLVTRGAQPLALGDNQAREQNPAWAPEGFELPEDFTAF